MYIPPFTISSTAIKLIAEISAQMERFAIRLEQSDGLRLRKANRAKAQNSLTIILTSPRWKLQHQDAIMTKLRDEV